MSTGTQIEVVMPQMGVSVSEGTITKWLKQPGEPVARDEPLLEISTDKVDTEVPSPGEGVLAEIIVPEGQTVEVGTVLARIGPAGSEPAAPEAPAPEAARARASAPVPDAEQVVAAEQPAPVPDAEQVVAAEPAAPVAAPVASRRTRGQRRRHRRLPSRQETDEPSSPPWSRASPGSTASTRRPSLEPAPAVA